MDITRSIGYVQIYFGIFLVMTGIIAGVFSGIVYEQNRGFGGGEDELQENTTMQEEIIYH